MIGNKMFKTNLLFNKTIITILIYVRIHPQFPVCKRTIYFAPDRATGLLKDFFPLGVHYFHTREYISEQKCKSHLYPAIVSLKKGMKPSRCFSCVSSEAFKYTLSSHWLKGLWQQRACLATQPFGVYIDEVAYKGLCRCYCYCYCCCYYYYH